MLQPFFTKSKLAKLAIYVEKLTFILPVVQNNPNSSLEQQSPFLTLSPFWSPI